MVVIYYIKLFRAEASRHFRSLMSLLLLGIEKTLVVTLPGLAQDALPVSPITLSNKTISKLLFHLKA